MGRDLFTLTNVPDIYAPLEVRLKSPQDFLKVKETLTRIGIPNQDNTVLTQTCHILHKKQRYFIVMFKELFALDGKEASLTVADIERRNTIASLLEDWGLVEIIDPDSCAQCAPLAQIKVIPYIDKGSWTLESKYSIGFKP